MRKQKEKVVFDRSPQIDKLKLALDVAVTTTMESQVPIADIVLALLTKADALCEIGRATGADMSSIAAAMGHDTSAEGVTQ
jgi:hypothetical protein